MRKYDFSNFLIASACMMLAACGGGGGGDSGAGQGGNKGVQNPDIVSPKLVDSAQTIDYFGDSTIEGWRTSRQDLVDTTAPEAFAAALTNRALHTVNNKGVSGQTACELLDGINLAHNWVTEMEQSRATVVILNHGINDAVASNAVSLAQYRSCLTNLARIAKTGGKRVIFETPNPIEANTSLEPYVLTMRDVATAESLSVIDQYAYLNQKYGGNADLITRDTLHPRDEIYIEKGQYAASQFSGFQ